MQPLLSYYSITITSEFADAAATSYHSFFHPHTQFYLPLSLPMQPLLHTTQIYLSMSLPIPSPPPPPPDAPLLHTTQFYLTLSLPIQPLLHTTQIYLYLSPPPHSEFADMTATSYHSILFNDEYADVTRFTIYIPLCLF